MYPTSLQTLVIFTLLFRSTTRCSNIFKRELKSNPATVLGEVYLYAGDKATNSLTVDDSKIIQVPLQDLQTISKKQTPNLNTHGFTYVSQRRVPGIERMVEFSDEHYFALKEDSIQLVKKLTGAKSAVAYASVYRGDNSLDSLKPVPVIHSDMSAKGADLTKGLAQDIFLKSDDPKEVEFGKHLKLGGKNVVIYNVWRPIRTVQDNPLGICKWNSVLEEDALDLGIIPTDVTNAPQPWKYRKGQRWFYLNKQRPDQVYVFMQHDSRAGKDGHGMNVPHASFSLRGDFSKKPTRMSFESVVFAIVDPIPPEGIFSRWAKDIKSLWNE